MNSDAPVASHPAAGAVCLEHLSKIFSGTKLPAVDNIDLDISPGEFLTLLGPSGSGKTTTLNMVAGFESPTSGSITIDGTEMANVTPHKRGLGMVFQNYALFPHMTVLDNVMFPLRRRRIPRKDARTTAMKTLDLVGLAGLEQRYPGQLSGGQQQRVAFARAVVFNPSVLLMDEPFGALDKKLRKHLQSEVARIHRELGSTFIFVTHDQEEALALSDRIALFNEGSIIQIGSPYELYQTPATRFVAEFLGDSNLFDGAVSDDGTRFRSGLGSFELDPAGRDHDGADVLLVRPEKLKRKAPEQRPSANQVEATLVNCTFQGSVHRLECRADDGSLLLALESESTNALPDLGDRLTLTWASPDAYLLRK